MALSTKTSNDVYTGLEYTSPHNKNLNTVISTGNVFVDWYNMMRYIFVNVADKETVVLSSSIDHLIVDDDNISVGYVDLSGEEPVLTYEFNISYIEVLIPTYKKM